MDFNVPKEFDYLDINEQISKALESIYYKKKNTLIIGNAGTGKSELLKVCKAIDEQNGIASAFLAPTGVAAVRIQGQTLHSFFKLPLSMIEPEYVPLKEEVEEMINAAERFYIDEISMVRADIFESIDSLMRRATQTYHKPFGGKQVIFIGDLYQLPPIIGNSSAEKIFYRVRYADNPYFFSSGIFNLFEDEFEKIEFSQIYRQKQSEFSDILNRIRKGKQTIQDIQRINENLLDFEIFKKTNSEAIYISPFNKVVDRINEDHLRKLKTDEYCIPAEIQGEINPKNHLVPEELWLKPGAKVMMLVNNFPLGYQNGTIGTFKEIIDKDLILVEVNGFDTAIERYEFGEYVYELEDTMLKKRLKGVMFQFPVKLAYALTAHKSQGSTFEAGYVDFGHKIFAEHMVYVMLSRFTELDKIALKRPLEQKDIMISPFVVEFMKTFQYNT